MGLGRQFIDAARRGKLYAMLKNVEKLQPKPVEPDAPMPMAGPSTRTQAEEAQATAAAIEKEYQFEIKVYRLELQDWMHYEMYWEGKNEALKGCINTIIAQNLKVPLITKHNDKDASGQFLAVIEYTKPKGDNALQMYRDEFSKILYMTCKTISEMVEKMQRLNNRLIIMIEEYAYKDYDLCYKLLKSRSPAFSSFTTSSKL